MFIYIKFIIFINVFYILTALPIAHYINNCNDSTEYYTTTKIINYSILYSITTQNNITSLTTIQLLYNNPTFEDYINLFTHDTNISLHGKIFFEYEILTPCYYTCIMEIYANKYTSKTVAKHLENYYYPGKTYTMKCNSNGCYSGSNYCKTFQTHDEL